MTSTTPGGKRGFGLTEKQARQTWNDDPQNTRNLCGKNSSKLRRMENKRQI
jgi:hypothetical protein